MNDLIRVRCKTKFKEDAKKKAEKKGYASVSEYIRQLIIKDK